MTTTHQTLCIQPLELERLIVQDKRLMIIDLRSMGEYMHNHISNATNMPSTTRLVTHLEDVDSSLNVVIVCRFGDQSALLVNKFLALGFENVFFLFGGMSAWEELHVTTRIIPNASNTYHLH
ncbi:rhodanese-like domain-containing protein [Cellvibrio sp. UBA7671]|uniref:rhodanese-like domain-containing protein n=1 Tax=Cellvibrio sp. UBA7671 TaxID=1946312 RepID=UPI002F355A3F